MAQVDAVHALSLSHPHAEQEMQLQCKTKLTLVADASATIATRTKSSTGYSDASASDVNWDYLLRNSTSLCSYLVFVVLFLFRSERKKECGFKTSTRPPLPISEVVEAKPTTSSRRPS